MRFDWESGEAYWIKPTSNRAKVGDLVGCINPDGYIQVQFKGKPYKLHRLLWFMWYKVWPEFVIDHIDRDRTNNRIQNLRDVTERINLGNGSVHCDNEYGIKGIAYDPNYAAKPHRVQISRGGAVIHRSHHETVEAARAKAEEVYLSLGTTL